MPWQRIRAADVWLHSLLIGTRWRVALPPGLEPWYPLTRRHGGPLSRSRRFWRREDLRPTGIRTRTVQSVVYSLPRPRHHYTARLQYRTVMLTLYILTRTELNSAWQSNRQPTFQETPQILRNMKFHYRVQRAQNVALHLLQSVCKQFGILCCFIPQSPKDKSKVFPLHPMKAYTGSSMEVSG